MSRDRENPYSAAAQFLGYDYQSRYALYYLFSMDEENELLIEAGDDLEVSQDGSKTLVSLKHKAEGDTLTDLSLDFWKSVNIWLDAYTSAEKERRSLVFFLMTTSTVSDSSFLINLTADRKDYNGIEDLANAAISKTENDTLIKIQGKFNKLSGDEKHDFLSRITIFNNSIRIENVADVIQKTFFKAIQPQNRQPVWERLWGWWDSQIIALLTKQRFKPISGEEVNDKLTDIASKMYEENLPIDYLDAQPTDDEFRAYKNMLFVKQIEEITDSTTAIRNAILDYYRAFNQRSRWLRHDFLINDDDLKIWENRLENEWQRYKDIVMHDISKDASEEELKEAGYTIYKWAQVESDFLRIRERVTEPYVRRGHFHILANEKPIPRIYWHPLFLERVEQILKG